MRFVLIGLMSFICSACGIHKDHFDCPPKPGLGCKSISEVDALVNKTSAYKNELVGNVDPKEVGINPICNLSSKTCRVSKEFPSYDSIIGLHKDNQALLDSIKIWFAPYKDEDGNYFEGNFVFTNLHKKEVVFEEREKK